MVFMRSPLLSASASVWRELRERVPPAEIVPQHGLSSRQSPFPFFPGRLIVSPTAATATPAGQTTRRFLERGGIEATLLVPGGFGKLETGV
jgi:hypothetical protein